MKSRSSSSIYTGVGLVVVFTGVGVVIAYAEEWIVHAEVKLGIVDA